MVKFINRQTGGAMWVTDERIEEYKAAGHKLAVVPVVEKPAEKPAKKPADRKGILKK